MKKLVTVLFVWLCSVSPSLASQLNVDPYFALGSTTMQAEVAGEKASAPSFYFAAGSTLNFLTPHLNAEFRFGFGGQYANFNGSVKSYTMYLLKPQFGITRNLDIYGLAGVTTMNVDAGGVSSTDTDTSYGLGLQYHVPNESLSLTGEWMQYHTNTDDSTTAISGMNISGISVSVSFDYY